jgi:hypothetical protein
MPSRRRVLVAGIVTAGTALSGCLSAESDERSSTSPTPGSPTPTPTSPTPVPGRSGSVESYITEASVVSHDATLIETEDDRRWIVTARLQLDAQNPEVATPRPVGVFFVFLDAEGETLYEVHEQAPMNTGDGPDTATLSAPFEPSQAGQPTFHSYRIELVHP